jgi:hypothetical protein
VVAVRAGSAAPAAPPGPEAAGTIAPKVIVAGGAPETAGARQVAAIATLPTVRADIAGARMGRSGLRNNGLVPPTASLTSRGRVLTTVAGQRALLGATASPQTAGRVRVTADLAVPLAFPLDAAGTTPAAAGRAQPDPPAMMQVRAPGMAVPMSPVTRAASAGREPEAGCPGAAATTQLVLKVAPIGRASVTRLGGLTLPAAVSIAALRRIAASAGAARNDPTLVRPEVRVALMVRPEIGVALKAAVSPLSGAERVSLTAATTRAAGRAMTRPEPVGRTTVRALRPIARGVAVRAQTTALGATAPALTTVHGPTVPALMTVPGVTGRALTIVHTEPPRGLATARGLAVPGLIKEAGPGPTTVHTAVPRATTTVPVVPHLALIGPTTERTAADHGTTTARTEGHPGPTTARTEADRGLTTVGMEAAPGRTTVRETTGPVLATAPGATGPAPTTVHGRIAHRRTGSAAVVPALMIARTATGTGRMIVRTAIVRTPAIGLAPTVRAPKAPAQVPGPPPIAEAQAGRPLMTGTATAHNGLIGRGRTGVILKSAPTVTTARRPRQPALGPGPQLEIALPRTAHPAVSRGGTARSVVTGRVGTNAGSAPRTHRRAVRNQRRVAMSKAMLKAHPRRRPARPLEATDMDRPIGPAAGRPTVPATAPRRVHARSANQPANASVLPSART